MTPNEHFEDGLIRVVREIMDLVRTEAAPRFQKYRVWKRESATRWLGTWEDRPASPKCLRRMDWKEYGARLQAYFRTRYPGLPKMVGTAVTGWHRLTSDRLLESIVLELCRRNPDFDVDDDCVAELEKELDALWTAKDIALEFMAPLINFDMEEGLDSVDLRGGLKLIRMTSEQVSSIYGGPDILVGMRSRTSPLPCALAGSFREPVCSGEEHIDSQFDKDVSPLLDRIVLGLQIFKPAAVALDGVHITRKCFSPFILAQPFMHGADAYIPADGYCLRADECGSLKKHLVMFMKKLHPTLKIACSRYGSAVVRRSAADRLLDAVVGLESILLHGVGDAKDRGELRFRLALRYATLVEQGSNRKYAFRTMRDIYDARSKIVHGEGAEKPFGIGDQKLSADEVAGKARDSLRDVILAFLPDDPRPRFTLQSFWDDLLFPEV